FLQHPDNLLFAEPRFLHDKVSPAALPLTLQWDTSEGEGQVRQVVELGASVKQVAARLGVSAWSLHRWIRERHVQQSEVAVGLESSSEIQWLRAELRRVTEERDMLEKAAAYFAKQAG
ncbi:MAG: transposase, partial [Burkholderia sp.]|uniref:transposase n=1 Tax=Burkholderia sp. TaxID=36773 RepID=UPI00281B8FF0